MGLLPAALLLLAGGAMLPPTAARVPPPYPKAAKAPQTLRVYSASGLAPGDEVTLETLGGGLARVQPELYRVTSAVNSSSDSYSLWLSEMVAHFGVVVDASALHDVPSLLGKYREQITGYVKHSMGGGADSTNAALTFIAGQNSTELLVAASTPRQAEKIHAHRIYASTPVRSYRGRRHIALSHCSASGVSNWQRTSRI
jgi:hypothetical protein